MIITIVTVVIVTAILTLKWVSCRKTHGTVITSIEKPFVVRCETVWPKPLLCINLKRFKANLDEFESGEAF